MGAASVCSTAVRKYYSAHASGTVARQTSATAIPVVEASNTSAAANWLLQLEYLAVLPSLRSAAHAKITMYAVHQMYLRNMRLQFWWRTMCAVEAHKYKQYGQLREPCTCAKALGLQVVSSVERLRFTRNPKHTGNGALAAHVLWKRRRQARPDGSKNARQAPRDVKARDLKTVVASLSIRK